MAARAETAVRVETITVHRRAAGTIAVVGNPNAGKSSVFNRLTGLHQRTAIVSRHVRHRRFFPDAGAAAPLFRHGCGHQAADDRSDEGFGPRVPLLQQPVVQCSHAPVRAYVEDDTRRTLLEHSTMPVA